MAYLRGRSVYTYVWMVLKVTVYIQIANLIRNIYNNIELIKNSTHTLNRSSVGAIIFDNENLRQQLTFGELTRCLQLGILTEMGEISCFHFFFF